MFTLPKNAVTALQFLHWNRTGWKDFELLPGLQSLHGEMDWWEVHHALEILERAGLATHEDESGENEAGSKKTTGNGSQHHRTWRLRPGMSLEKPFAWNNRMVFGDDFRADVSPGYRQSIHCISV